MKYIKNIGFIIFTALIIIIVGLLNFLIDPYFVFKNDYDLELTNIPRDHYHILLKAYKNFTADTVFLGSSSTHSLFFRRQYYRYYFNLVRKDFFSYEQQYHLLKDYLHFHPETKRAYIFITYPSFYEDCSEPVSQFDGDELNFKDYMFLLFSAETTKRSLKCIKEGKLNQYRDFIFFNIRNNIKRIVNQNFKKNTPSFQQKEEKEVEQTKYNNQKYEFYFFPNVVIAPPRNFEESKNKNNIKKNFEYLIKMSELLKEKNIDTHFVFHPYHATYLSLLVANPTLKKLVDDLKRTCVQISDNDVYDFSVINKYTTSDYDNSYLYTDYIHPNYVLGMKVFKVLHDNISEDGLYLKLNKKNVEKQIANSNKKLEDYRQKNKSLIDARLNFYKNYPNTDILKQEMKNFDGAPKYVTQELELYSEKEEKIYSLLLKGEKIKLGTWENKF